MKKSKKITRWLAGGIILAAVALSYGNSLSNGFHYDDVHTILRNPAVRSLIIAAYSTLDPSAFSIYQTPMVRPLTLVTYAVNYRLGGFDLLGWRLLNLLIHFFAALLVKSIVTEIIRRSSDEDRAEVAGTLAGLFFAVHPLQTEAVNYMSARSMLLVALFYLLSVYLYLVHVRAHTRVRPYRGRGFALRSASLLVFVLALLSREDAVTLPAAIVMLDVFVSRPPTGAHAGAPLHSAGIVKRGRFLGRIKMWLPYWVILGIYFIYRRIVLGAAVSATFVRSIPENLGLQVWSVGIYQKLLIWPRGLSISHPVDDRVIGTPVWIGILVILFLEVGIVLLSLKKRPFLFLLTGWYFLALSPTLLIPLNQVASEHRTYLAMLGPALLVGWLFTCQRGQSPPSTVPYKISILCLMMAMLFWAIIGRERNTDWMTEKSLWKSAVEVHPRDDKAWILYGLALKDERDYDGAITAYRRSINIQPTSGAYDNLAVACGLKLDRDCMRENLLKSLSINPNDPIALFNIGEVYLDDGNLDAAEAAYRRALLLRPVFPEAHFNFAIFLFKTHRGTMKEILDHLAISLQQDPYQKDADEIRKTMAGIVQYMQFMEDSQKIQNQKGLQ